MKLAEALTLRGDQDKKIRGLRERTKNTARYVEGETPVESAAELIVETRELIRAQAELITRINHTNARTYLTGVDGLTITAALAERDRISQEAGFLKDIADEASPSRDPYSRRKRVTELPERTDLEVKNLRRQADSLASTHRELDSRIQQVNWATDLL
jgi:hypothetical protein